MLDPQRFTQTRVSGQREPSTGPAEQTQPKDGLEDRQSHPEPTAACSPTGSSRSTTDTGRGKRPMGVIPPPPAPGWTRSPCSGAASGTFIFLAWSFSSLRCSRRISRWFTSCSCANSHRV